MPKGSTLSISASDERRDYFGFNCIQRSQLNADAAALAKQRTLALFDSSSN